MSSPSTSTKRLFVLGAWLLAGLLGFASQGAHADNIEKVMMPGAVIKGHAKYEEECEKCHEKGNKGAQTRLCLDCHKETRADVQNKQHLHGHQTEKECRSCHTDHKGRDAKIVVMDKKNFDHKITGLQLKGAHQKSMKEKCEACHEKGKKLRDAPLDCYSCHKKDDVHKGELSKECDQCHSEENWKNGKFDHDKTKFKLEGSHKETACKDCHLKNVPYKKAPSDCWSCHKEDDKKDGHNGSFGKKCETCHNAVKWDQTSKFNHDRDTKYKLKGKHIETECVDCHKTPLYVPPKTVNTCIGCHKVDDDKNGHKGSLGNKCETCHDEKGWKKTSFDHDRDTKYPLEGKHKDVKCNDCHTSGLKPPPGKTERVKAPTTCIGCHKKQDDDKGHKGKFGEKCETCHKIDDWKKTFFNHDKDTKYALKGKHKDTKCVACHTGDLYKDKLKDTCISCHKDDDMKKGHKGQLGDKCESCHDEVKWKGVKYDHNKSRFPLLGKHIALECKECHKSLAYKDAKPACYSCHEKDDTHKRKLGTLCGQCHNARSWKSWDFDHQATKFPLRGAHVKIKCEDCHSKPLTGKVVLPGACVDCHTKDDVHRGGFGGQCDRCHGEDTWKSIKR